MVDALHHVINHQKTIDELWRLLKPGGRLVIEEMDLNQPLVKLVALAEKIALMRSHFLSPQAIAGLFPEVGGEIRIERLGSKCLDNRRQIQSVICSGSSPFSSINHLHQLHCNRSEVLLLRVQSMPAAAG